MEYLGARESAMGCRSDPGRAWGLWSRFPLHPNSYPRPAGLTCGSLVPPQLNSWFRSE